MKLDPATKAAEPRVANILCHLDARYGGLSSAVPALARATAITRRYAVELTALCDSDEVVDEDAGAGIQLRRLPFVKMRGLADVQLYISLRSYLETADILHIHGIWQQHCSVSAMLARQSAVPIVVSAHGMLESWAVGNKRWKKALYSSIVERRNLRSAACLRALTRCEVNDYRQFGLTNPVVVIPNGITLPSGINGDLFLETFPSLRGRRLVIFLSRIHFKKGLEPLCRAWARVSPRFPDAHLILAGPDFENTRSSVETLVSELGINTSVLFTGMLSGDLKWSALAAADISTLPSYSEGFSVSILEAMAMRRPVLISHQCNFDEVAELGCGLVIQPETAEIENALSELLNLPARALDEMGAKGRALVEHHYSWSVIGNQMADVYDWLRGGPKPSSAEIYD